MAIRSESATIALEPNSTDTHVVPTTSIRVFTIGCLAILICASTGCSITSRFAKALNKSDCIDDFMIDYRNSALAEKSWHCHKHLYSDRLYLKDFKAGYIAGYINIASGGNGCCPCMAPASYLGWRYQSAQGQAAVNAWFEGYPYGVKAAEQDGIGNWSQVNPCSSSCFTPSTVPMMQDGVPAADPFYPQEQIGPGMLEGQEMEMEWQPNQLEEIAPPEPEAVMNGTFEGIPVSSLNDDEPLQVEIDESGDGLVSRFRVAQLPEAETGAGLPGPLSNEDIADIFAPMNEINEPTGGSTPGPASEDLQFSFE